MSDSDSDLDETDRAILYELQKDARNNTNAEISDEVGVSASTVGKRIRRLEEHGVIKGYRPELDYEQAGLPIEVLFVCTTPITDRESLIEEAREVDGVADIREMMTGEGNVHIRVIGSSNDDITRIAQAIDNLGIGVSDEILMRNHLSQPLAYFREASNR